MATITELMESCGQGSCRPVGAGAAIIGLILNLLLLAVTVFNTKTRVGNYRYLISLSCIVNCIYAAAYGLTLPTLHSDEGNFILFSVHPPFTNRTLLSICLLAFWVCSLQIMLTTSTQFCHRFWIISKGIQNEQVIVVLILILLNLLFFLIYGWFSYSHLWPSEDLFREVDEHIHEEIGAALEKTAFIGFRIINDWHEVDWSVVGFLVATLLLMLIEVFLSVFCAFGVRKQMKICMMSTLRKRETVQVLRSLSVQIAAPIIFNVIPMITTVLLSAGGLHLTKWFNVVMFVFAVLPIAIPAANILLINEYRNIFIKFKFATSRFSTTNDPNRTNTDSSKV